MSGIRCVLFDFGDVIGFFDHEISCRRLAEMTGGEHDAAAVRGIVFGGGLEEAYDCGRLGTEEFIQELRKRLGIQGSEAEIRRAWGDIFTRNDAVADLLRPLREAGIRLVLGSNTNEIHYEQFRGQFEEELSHFAALVLSYEAGARKPGAAFYERCLAEAGCEAAECLYVDDRADLIEAGRQLGLIGLQYHPETDLRGELKARGVEI